MFWRTLVKIAEWTGAVLAALALIVGGGGWLLSRGPLSLDWLAPYVASTFTQSAPGLIAAVDHTSLRLGDGPSLEIIANGLHLKRVDGGAELTLPQVALSLSPRAALLGQVAPTRIVLHGPRLNLLRAEDGEFHIELAGEKPGKGDWIEALLYELSHPPNRNDPFGYLTVVQVTDAALTVDDRKLGVTWTAQRLDAALRRGNDGLAGDLALVVERDGVPAHIHGDFAFKTETARLRTELSFDSLRPSLYAAALPAFAPFAAFDLPLGGQISMSFDLKARQVSDFWCDLQLGQGRIVNDRFAGGELKIVSGTLRAIYDPASQRLDLEQFEASLNAPNGPRLRFTGAIEHFDPLATTPQAFAGNGRVDEVSLADLQQLWPEHIAIHAREWIMGHVRDGVVTKAQVAVGGTVTLGSSAGLVAKLGKVRGDLAFRDAAVQYFPPLSPVTNISGAAEFDSTQFVIHANGGTVRDVKATGGTVLLTKLDTDNEEATIDVKVAGPLATVLDELNMKPLRYAHALGVDPAGVKGTAEGDVHFHLPMKKNLQFSMVEYSARGALHNVAIAKILFGRDLTDGELRLTVTRRGGVDLDGAATLDGVPITLDWKEGVGNASPRTQYHLRGVFSDAARHQLGIDWLPDAISGPVGVDLEFTRRRNDIAETEAALDLTPATLTIDKLGWVKKAGVPAAARLHLTADDDRSVRVSKLQVHGGGLEAMADITLTGAQIDARIASASIYRLTIGSTDVAGVVTRRPEGGWSIEVHGKSIDASRLIDDMQKETPAGTRDPPVVIDANVARILLGPNRAIGNVHAHLYSDGLHWQQATIDAAPAPGKKLSLRFGGELGDRNFRMTSDDLGAVLHLLDISNKVEGGRLAVMARAEDVGKHRALRGTLNGYDYRVVDAPAFARLLSLASFSGPAALVSGTGIPFSRLQGDFLLDHGTVQLHNARAYGEAIGVNATGSFDYRRNQLDMSGTLVPAYLINSLLGNIPLIGDLLLGGKGEGIFAAKFRVAGSTTDPGISVNPLSALAPGFLRGLFLFDAGKPDQGSAKSARGPNGG